MEIIWKGSPNFTKDRTGRKLKYIIIHWFGTGTLESANARFQNPASKASAHYGISKGRIWQWVNEKDASWNAGNYNYTLESIGIEHDAILNGHDLSEEDYQLSGQLVREITQRWNIPLDRKHIIGHREVKPTQCPGTINIDKIINIAKGESMRLVDDNGTVFLVGKKGKIGVADEPFFEALKAITDVETGSTTDIPQVKVIETKLVAPFSGFVIKDS